MQAISDYLNEVRSVLSEHQFELDPLYAQILLSEFEDIIKSRCVKCSIKRSAGKVEAYDVNHVLKKLGRPAGLLKKIKGCFNQPVVLESLKLMKEVLQKSKKPVVLDAGCGWEDISRDFNPRVLRISKWLVST